MNDNAKVQLEDMIGILESSTETCKKLLAIIDEEDTSAEYIIEVEGVPVSPSTGRRASFGGVDRMPKERAVLAAKTFKNGKGTVGRAVKYTDFLREQVERNEEVIAVLKKGLAGEALAA